MEMRCEEGRRGGRLEEEDKRQRVEKTIRRGGEKVAASTSHLIKGKEEEREFTLMTSRVLRLRLSWEWTPLMRF